MAQKKNRAFRLRANHQIKYLLHPYFVGGELSDILESNLGMFADELADLRVTSKEILLKYTISHLNIVMKGFSLDEKTAIEYFNLDPIFTIGAWGWNKRIVYLSSECNKALAALGKIKRKKVKGRAFNELRQRLVRELPRWRILHYVDMTKRINKRYWYSTDAIEVEKTLNGMDWIVNMWEWYYRYDKVLYNRQQRCERPLK